MNETITAETIDGRSPETSHDDALRARAAAEIERRGLSQNRAATMIGGLSAATLSLWLRGKYSGDVGEVDAKVRRWLDHGQAAAELFVPGKTGFQRTETASRIWMMLMQAQRVPSIVVIAGVPGIGKTMTARAYKAESPNVWLATMDPTISSPAQVLAEIAREMGVIVGSHTTLRDRIGDRLVGSEGLIVIDEAQHLNVKALDMVRSLFDRYGVGVALVGNYGLFGATSAPSKTHGFAQFFRRVRKRAKFEEPSARDVELMLDAWGVEAADQRRFLSAVAAKMWGLAGAENALFEASTIAAGEGQPLELRHLKSAWAGLNHLEG